MKYEPGIPISNSGTVGVRVSPAEFKKVFSHAVSYFKEKLFTLWDFPKGDYTFFVLSEVFPKIAEELGISVYNSDYYYIDSIFYTERDVEHFSVDATYAKCISIAVEHEHDISGSAVEMNRLQIYNAPLKVLITYAKNDLERQWHLARYTKILVAADVFGDFATLRRQLVVFGSKDGIEVSWKFYCFDGMGFQEL